MNKTVIIIGAGLSGLTSALLLKQKGIEVSVLEARERAGGRILTHLDDEFHCEMGATWLGPQHTVLLSLFDQLEIPRFEQRYDGKGIVDYGAGHPHYQFEPNIDDPPTYRIGGGSTTLINSLKSKSGVEITYGVQVKGVVSQNGKMLLKTSGDSYMTDFVISTIPPKLLVQSITFEPDLGQEVKAAMNSTHTWMSNSIKFGIRYAQPFWRSSGFSGTVMSPAGPVMEMYDHSDTKDETYGLMGFLNENLRNLSEGDRKQTVLNYLGQFFGEEVSNYLTYYEKDWSEDALTTTADFESIKQHPNYDNKLLQNELMDGKLLISGTEASVHYPGYMEGAVYVGIKSAQRIMQMQ